jgi:hypothetical protein
MHRDFGGLAFESREEGRDRELTLGPMMLIGLALGLCAVCAMCFLWGYSVGHHGAVQAVAPQASANNSVAMQLDSGQSKPAPSPNSPQPPAVAQAVPAEDGIAPAAGNSDAPVTASYAASISSLGSTGSAAVVQAALPAQPTAAQRTAASAQVRPALGQGTPWMVQIAAVSQQEDADVLESALRKHGYVVSAQRDPTDNLLHVQVGPFATHADAASMRQRLLNDGYNAIIEP